jgi:hypothetical protein
MKTTIALILCACLATSGVRAEVRKEKQPPVKKEDRQPQFFWGVLLVLSITAAGAYVVIKVSSKFPSPQTPVRVVLEKSYDNATWTPVVTNTVILNGQQPVELFRDHMTDFTAMYRARCAQ